MRFKGGSALGPHVEEKERTCPISHPDSHSFDETQISVLDPSLHEASSSTREPPTVSSATLNGRWYLPVPAAWGWAVLLPSAISTASSPTTPRPQRNKLSDWKIKIQHRHAVSLSIPSSQPVCRFESIHYVQPRASRAARHAERWASPPEIRHADAQVPAAEPSSAPCATAAPSASQSSHPQYQPA